MIEFMQFRPVKRDKSNSLVGFLSFKWGKEFQFTNVPVHKLLKPKGNQFVRLLYLDDARPQGEAYYEILEEVNAYLLANYRENLK